MLLWQQNNQRQLKKLSVIAHIVWCLLCVHMLFLLSIFMCKTKRKPYVLTVSRANAQLPVVFVSDFAAKKAVRAVTVPAKKRVASKPTPIHKKTTLPKKKTVQSSSKKTGVPDAVTSKQGVAQKKQEVKNVEKKAKEVKPSLQKPAEKQQTLEALIEQQEVTAVNRHERDILMMQHCIAEQVSPHFKVPPGLSEGLSCEILVTVDQRGKVRSSSITRSSGTVLFDCAVEYALAHVEQLPLWAAGKEFALTFS